MRSELAVQSQQLLRERLFEIEKKLQEQRETLRKNR
jgi:hypothetical protein